MEKQDLAEKELDIVQRMEKRKNVMKNTWNVGLHVPFVIYFTYNYYFQKTYLTLFDCFQNTVYNNPNVFIFTSMSHLGYHDVQCVQ